MVIYQNNELLTRDGYYVTLHNKLAVSYSATTVNIIDFVVLKSVGVDVGRISTKEGKQHK